MHTAQAVAAASAVFKADPDGNSEYSAPTADARNRAAKKALALIGATNAITAMGISAKARIVPMVLGADDCYFAGNGSFIGSIDAVSARFNETFAADVKSYMRTVVEVSGRLHMKPRKAVKHDRS